MGPCSANCEKQKAAHLAQGGVRCPYCGEEDIEGGFVETGEGRAVQKMTCQACGKTWADIYHLADMEEVRSSNKSDPRGEDIYRLTGVGGTEKRSDEMSE